MRHAAAFADSRPAIKGASGLTDADHELVARLKAGMEPDYVVIGGGNLKKLDSLPPGCQHGANVNAFAGGFRDWQQGGVRVSLIGGSVSVWLPAVAELREWKSESQSVKGTK